MDISNVGAFWCVCDPLIYILLGFFPIREYGVNPEAQPLQPREIEAMQNNPEIVSRLLKSYKMVCVKVDLVKLSYVDLHADARILRHRFQRR